MPSPVVDVARSGAKPATIRAVDETADVAEALRCARALPAAREFAGR
jgi:hypothetical protein